MELQDRIAALAGWTGWRRFAPAAGSVVTHAALGLGLVTLMAASTSPRPSPPRPRPPAELQVMLIAETPPVMRQTAPTPSTAPPASSPKTDSQPSAPAAKPRKSNKPSAAQPAVTPSDDEGVYVGPSVLSQSDVPLGLRGMLESDPCNPKDGLSKRGDCQTKWNEKLAEGNLLVSPSLATLKRMYPGFGESSGGLHMGGPPAPKGSGIMQAQGPMPGGPAGLGGINDLVGRLPPAHPDPGFGD